MMTDSSADIKSIELISDLCAELSPVLHGPTIGTETIPVQTQVLTTLGSLAYRSACCRFGWLSPLTFWLGETIICFPPHLNLSTCLFQALSSLSYSLSLAALTAAATCYHSVYFLLLMESLLLPPNNLSFFISTSLSGSSMLVSESCTSSSHCVMPWFCIETNWSALRWPFMVECGRVEGGLRHRSMDTRF